MHARIFSSKMIPNSDLESTIEWHTSLSDKLQKQIVRAHIDSFLDIYRDYSEEQLDLKPDQTKKTWLTKMIKDELEEVNKGNLFLATVSVQDTLAGFIVCAPVKARHEDLKVDLYISLLAIKSLRFFKSQNKIHIGLGRELVNSAESKFPEANTLTLDTRLINKAAMLFYEKIGFSSTGKRTLGDNHHPDYYTGYERSVMRHR